MLEPITYYFQMKCLWEKIASREILSQECDMTILLRFFCKEILNLKMAQYLGKRSVSYTHLTLPTKRIV